MSQTRLQSLIETTINIGIGYGIALVSQIVVFPLFGINIPLSDNVFIGAIFTVISIARSYLVRRMFNRLHNANVSEYNKRNAICGENDGNMERSTSRVL